MVARLGDFGISKLLGQEDSVIQTITLATIGYMAPANLKKRGKQKSKVYNPDPSKDIPKIVSKHADPNDFDGQKVSDKAEDSEVSANKVEAEITLKMAKDLGVQFADFDQSMLKQLEILETGAT
ncbi:hypothetical protein V6N13_087914 [Hibiscus sabdariffa]